MAKRHCEYGDCRAWARRGTAYCVAHPDGQPRAIRQAQGAAELAATPGPYDAYVPVVDLESAQQSPPGDLRLEIAVVRLALKDLLAAGLPPAEQAGALNKITSSLARLFRVNQQAGDTAGSDLATAVETYLAELGLGWDNPT